MSVSEGDSTSSRDNYSAINDRQVDDISVQLFYKPRTLSLLILSIVTVIYHAFTRDSEVSVEDNVWSGKVLFSIAYKVLITTLFKVCSVSRSFFSSFHHWPFRTDHSYDLTRLFGGLSSDSVYSTSLDFSSCCSKSIKIFVPSYIGSIQT